MKVEQFREFLQKKGSFNKQKNLEEPVYDPYALSKGESFWLWMEAAGAVIFLAYFFYRSFWAVIPLCPIGMLIFRSLLREKRKKQKKELLEEFRECLLAVVVLLKAGYSAENAFRECEEGMLLMYGKEAMICKELRLLKRGLRINITLENLLAEMGARSECEEMMQFAEVFEITKRSGGNMAEVMDGTAAVISKKIETENEITLVLSGKRMEMLIMRIIPFFIVFYLNVSSRGFFDCLYHNVKGICIMTGCLFLYLGATIISRMTTERIEKGI